MDMQRRRAVEEGNGLYSKPVSPLARIFLRQPKLDLVINSFITFQNPVDVAAVKAAMTTSLRNCPLLRSIPVTKRCGRLRWNELPNINVNDHIIILPEEQEHRLEDYQDDESYVNSYVAGIATWPEMRRDKPLWEVHVLPRRRRSLVLRVHHSLGDCVSLLALFLASCDSADDVDIVDSCRVVKKQGAKHALVKPSLGLCMRIRDAWRMLRIVLFAARSGIYRIEDKTIIAGGVGVERMPRKLATLTLTMDDMIAVKNKLGAKINDVFMGITAYGLVKYLKLKSTEEMVKDPVITVVNAVNLREQGTMELLKSIRGGENIKWGNKALGVCMPVRLVRKTTDPLQYVRDVRSTFNKKKSSNDALNSYRLLFGSCYFVEKLQALHYYKGCCHTSLLLSNIRGPTSLLALHGNLVTKIGVTTSSLPTALEIHMISYNGKAFLQFLVASEIIPDPELLCSLVSEALREMKVAALGAVAIE
ncbi:wax ester synthase/diacylglycerol acyltransferase 3-like [Wolffia australiana]